MTRKERAITHLKQMCSDGRYLGSGSYVPLEVLEDFNLAIKVLEQDPKWIPVSERLPEDSGEYLVTVADAEDRDYLQVGTAWFAHPNDYDIGIGEWRELMIDEKVIAWMPLPTPYKAESEG